MRSAARPQTRYAIACAALCVMLAAPVVTARLMSSTHADTAELNSSTTDAEAGASALPRSAAFQSTASRGSDAAPVASAPARLEPEQLVAGLSIAWLCGVAATRRFDINHGRPSVQELI